MTITADRIEPGDELTTKQAAEVLGVSRPFLIRLLEKGVIAHRKVGRHRRVLTKDVLAHQQTMQFDRKKALDELVEASEDVGGYDLASQQKTSRR